MSRVIISAVVIALTGSATAGTWQNKGQSEFVGGALDLDSGGRRIVAAASVGGFTTSQWMVRGIDRLSGATVWENRFGPPIFGLAKDVAIEGSRAFAAGWIYTPGLGFGFTVRAYDIDSGGVVWSQVVGRGPQCLDESPGFARCVAKTLTVKNGRVFVAGHLTRTAANSDFAILAFDARTGAQLWESVTDPTGTGAADHAWAVSATDDGVFALGEVGDFSALLLQRHDPATGAILWKKTIAGARNFTSKNTLAADASGVFISGMDEQGRFFVGAYDAATGTPRWQDRVDDGGRIGEVTALSISHDDNRTTVFAAGVIGCDPTTFVGCKLGLRAYDAAAGLRWSRADPAAGGDWTVDAVATTAGRVFVGGEELREDGVYHATVKAYDAGAGAFSSTADVDDGSGTGAFGIDGFVDGLLARGNALLVAASMFRSDGGEDFVVRRFQTH